MKKVWLMLIVIIAIILAGCTGTTVVDPITGVWRDQLIGVSQMEFSENGQYHANVMSGVYDGNWSKIDQDHYQIRYVSGDNNTTEYQSIIDYDPINKSICLENAQDILYAKISDQIVGNWTDQLKTSSMYFDSDHTWHIIINDTSFTGNWTKVNDTGYIVLYPDNMDNNTVYREMVYYNRSSNMIQLDNLPYITFTKVM